MSKIDISISAQNGENLTEAEYSFIADACLNAIPEDQQEEVANILKAIAAQPDDDEQDLLDRLDNITYPALLKALDAAGQKFEWKCNPAVFSSLIVETSTNV